MIKKFARKSVRMLGRFFNWIADFFQSAFLGIHLSIRRKITFDFLALYIVLTTISTIIVSIVFTYYTVDNSSSEINSNVNNLLRAYDREVFKYDELVSRLDNLSEGKAIKLSITVENEGAQYQIKTKDYIESDSANNVFGKIYYLLKYGYIVKRPYYFNLLSDGVGRNNYTIYQIHLFERYSRYTIVLALLMTVASSITFFFLSVIGGGRVKSILSPIYKMTRTAAQISGRNMEERLDISSTKYELRDLAITINDMLDRLNQDYSRQKQFVSDVSHELRTPIAIINGYGKMVSRWGKTDEKILHEALDAILDEADNMNVLVENLLTLARSDNQTLSFEYEIFNLSTLVEKTAEQARIVNTREQIIVSEIEPELWCNLDFAKIKQVMRIFLDNAIKYTDNGKEITVFCYSDEEHIYVGVRDTGIGVEAKEISRLFERFYRLDESRARETGGHGLGLAIAKALVTGQGGIIRARSKKNVGSEFAMVFPKDKYLVE